MVSDGDIGPSVRSEVAAGLQQAQIVSAIATWCEALHGSASIDAAFADLCEGLGAEAGLLIRTRRTDGHQTRIAQHDPGAERSFGRPLRLSLAESVFGQALDGARAGTIWHEADAPEPSDPFLREFQTARGFREFCVLVLASGATERDVIELHFRDPRSERVHATLAAVLPTVARTWATRQFGIISRDVAFRRLDAAARGAAAPAAILGPMNPARLSRCEYRICLCLSRGLSVRGAASELGITETTVRSHLRSIYAKTQTASQAELLFRLIGTRVVETGSATLRYA